MSFGLSMQGLEGQIFEIAAAVRSKFDQVTYLELGVAGGATLCSVAKIISVSGKGWRAVGVDLPNGYSLEKDQVEQNCLGQHFTVGWIKPNGWNRIDPTWNRVTVVLADCRDFFEGMWQEPIHLALIDACHCNECVKRDFLNVEKYVPIGGAVMFHDFEVRINDPQPHGGHCDVVGACKDLGLLDRREGWSLPRILVADHSASGADMMVVERTQ